ncbi:citrate/2-methylcitrate synthase [Lactococcus nasutitermitis]|uniref:Citrate synthase n=1 Tax=Lactococcus nasutitermitis TaxID=1652957 RepID=A0ABV9JCW0_9LACT|nr:citrate/2-methylcitrate synthase [Lactococcus nasutitermitis]
MKQILEKYQKKIMKNSVIPTEFYQQYDVKKGLRDINGKGVLAGLTNISAIHSFDTNGKQIPGILEYRAYNIKDIVGNLRAENRFGFEENAYLLLFGELPTRNELKDFQELLAKKRTLPEYFVRENVLANPTSDIINSMSRCLLTLASYDPKASDISIENVLDQSLNIIANFPLLAIYAYQAYNHYRQGASLYIHYPDTKLTTAENILRMLRPDKKYTDTEAKVLDIALILHMEHGGGNNSTFTTHVVTSSGTDTYATIAAALSSLKGPKHGGANIKAAKMLENIKENIQNYEDEEEIEAYLYKILNKEAFDCQGLIYGIGHAIYSVSDPRFEVFKAYVAALAKEKGLEEEFELYEKVTKLAPQVITNYRKTYKTISPNIDFYSGFVYRVLGIPQELYTPLFAIARIIGWSAHRIEELINMNKIIRPAYESVLPSKTYEKIEERK